MTPAPHLSPVCGATAALPEALTAQAVALAGRHASAGSLEAESHLRCCLQVHEFGRHYALAMELPGAETGAIWASWEPVAPPCFVLEVLPDCSAADEVSREPCSEFAGHSGGHTYQLAENL
jgi:hypothetical protein